jgi:hypothetical protein
MQDSLPAGWLAFTGWELNPLVRNERFPSGYISSSSPGFTLTLDGFEHDGTLVVVRMTTSEGSPRVWCTKIRATSFYAVGQRPRP